MPGRTLRPRSIPGLLRLRHPDERVIRATREARAALADIGLYGKVQIVSLAACATAPTAPRPSPWGPMPATSARRS
jgi:hypothetical protein